MSILYDVVPFWDLKQVCELCRCPSVRLHCTVNVLVFKQTRESLLKISHIQ